MQLRSTVYDGQFRAREWSSHVASKWQLAGTDQVLDR